MKVKQAVFIRKGNIITTVATKNSPASSQTFPSINAAKRHSRTLQPQLGDGTLRVEQHKQKKPVIKLDKSYTAAERNKPKLSVIDAHKAKSALVQASLAKHTKVITKKKQQPE